MDLLDIKQAPVIDKSIVSKEYHIYQPIAGGEFNYNDEIRMTVQDVDTLTLPCDSYLYIEGNLTGKKADGTQSKTVKFINNGLSHLFREIRYELNGVVLDSVRNVGLTSTLKGYASYNSNESNKLANAGWFPKINQSSTKTEDIIIDKNGNFNVCIPLKMLLGFFEDYNKVIVNVKQELVILRTSDDSDATFNSTANESVKINIKKIYWKVPHVQVSLENQLMLSKIINKNTEIIIPFRSWELIEYPKLPTTNRLTWAVKTSNKLESPRHILVGFHIDRKGSTTKNMATFDDINLKNLKVFLNTDRYPYNDVHIDFKSNKFATLYEMFSKFRSSYYGLKDEPIFSPDEYKNIAPIVYVDCSYQKDSIQSSSVVLRIDLETGENIPENTSAYCLIIHDKIFSYNPLTKLVKQL